MKRFRKAGSYDLQIGMMPQKNMRLGEDSVAIRIDAYSDTYEHHPRMSFRESNLPDRTDVDYSGGTWRTFDLDLPTKELREDFIDAMQFILDELRKLP